MASAGPYSLIHSILAHDGAVRSVAVSPNGELISGCQSDAPNFRRWKENGDSWEEVGQSVFHDHWVTAITTLDQDISRDFYPDGCIVTGCQDSNIRIFSLDGAPLTTLRGHSKGVISFSWTADKHLVSGSWDGTAKIWDLASSSCMQTLEPHENGVQVLVLSNGYIATTSTGESVNGKPANFKLRFWDPTTGQQVGDAIQDHLGSIRSITALPAIDGFATTGNDGRVVLRTMDGTAIDSMEHPPQGDGGAPFVFGCTALDTDSGMELVSCGEDGSVLVWSGAELVQSIPHPSSVWAVRALPGTGGDFVTCGDDGFLRIFSRNPAKTGASRVQQLQSEFEQEVQAALARRSSGPSAEEVAKAPRWENRHQHPGKSADQVCVFNKDGSLIAAQWISGSWVIVGTVTSTGDGGYLNEVWYDHIMPVEIEGPMGVRTLKLGHNNGENAFVAAQRFIDQNELQQSYLGQIADWIMARSGQSMPTIGASSGAPAPAVDSGPASGYTAQPPAPPAPTYPYTVTALTTYDDVPPMPKLLAKFQEFNQILASQGGTPSVVLSTAEVEQIDALTRVLSETSYYHSSTVTSDQLRALLKPLQSWSAENLFPLYDVLRVLATHPHGAETLAGPQRAQLQQVVQRTLGLLKDSTTHASTVLTATRFLCNCIRAEPLRAVVYADLSLVPVLQVVHDSLAVNGNKLVRAAASRIVVNAAGFATGKGLFARATLSANAASVALQCVGRLLDTERESAEVLVNALCALGTLAVSPSTAGVITDKGHWRQRLLTVQSGWEATKLQPAQDCLAATLALF